jgi:pyruvate dehydrogenase E1 component alpha subunit
MGTAIQRSSAETHLFKRGESFLIEGEAVDGMDVLAVRDAGARALAHARGGEGPVLLEMKTYRYRGHSMSDPGKYRTREEIEDVRSHRDPIDHVKALLLDGGHADEDALKAIDKEIRDRIVAAAQFAQDTPEPDEKELMTDIYI